jgi:hypothetical protein
MVLISPTFENIINQRNVLEKMMCTIDKVRLSRNVVFMLSKRRNVVVTKEIAGP